MTDELQRTVEEALAWEPSFDTTDIGVSVDHGVVTLRGDVTSYTAKSAAERVTLRVYGVKAVANELNVRLIRGDERTDTEIAQAAIAALTWNTLVPADRITVTVSKGWVTLNGTLDYYHQSVAAERTVRDLIGVKGVSNTILLQAPVIPIRTADVIAKITAAFRRSAHVDARRINVNVRDRTVILSGSVSSSAERQEAESGAWAAPGVTRVDDRLTIVP
jgi:osmotically-inducible protein OsmY